jgi:hypothetical protein
MAFRCDGEKDCPNGDDEMFCAQVSNVSPVHQMAQSVAEARQRRAGSGSGLLTTTTPGPTGPIDISDLDPLLEDGTLDAEGRANAVNEIIVEQLAALGFTTENIAAGQVALAAAAATFDLEDVMSCADVTTEQTDAAKAAVSSAVAPTGTIVTLSTYCSENAAGGVTLQVEAVVARAVPVGSTLAATTAALIADLEAALAAIPGVVGFVVEEIDVQTIVDALSGEMKIFAIVEDACLCAREGSTSAKGGKSGKSGKGSKGGATGGVTITLLREGSGSEEPAPDEAQDRVDATAVTSKKGKKGGATGGVTITLLRDGSGSEEPAPAEGRMDAAAVTSKKGKKGTSAMESATEMRTDDGGAPTGKGAKSGKDGKRRRRRSHKGGKSSKDGTTAGGVTITLLREGSGEGESGDAQARADATAATSSKKGKKGSTSSDGEMKMATGKSAKEGRVSPTCVCGTSSGKSKKTKKGSYAALTAAGVSSTRDTKPSLFFAGIAGAMAVVGVALAKTRSNRRGSTKEPSESDPLLGFVRL